MLDKELFDKGLKILKSDGSATLMENLSPKVLRIKAITIVLLAKTACIRSSIKMQDWQIILTQRTVIYRFGLKMVICTLIMKD